MSVPGHNAAMDNNPLVPVWYDIVWSGVVLLTVVLAVAALVSLIRSDLDPVTKAGWAAIVILLPVIGAAVWFILQRRRVDA